MKVKSCRQDDPQSCSVNVPVDQRSEKDWHRHYVRFISLAAIGGECMVSANCLRELDSGLARYFYRFDGEIVK